MDTIKIPALEALLGLKPPRTIVGHNISRLIAPGENYGSQIVALDVQVKDEDGEDTLYTVAKMPPPSEFLQRNFNTPVTFKNEIKFYKILVPCLNDFQRFPMDLFPKFLGARLSLDPGKDVVDEGAVLVLENLKMAGYQVVDKTEGFNFDGARLILGRLAQFHAVALAMKMRQPEEFDRQIRPYLQEYSCFQLGDGIVKAILDKFRKIVREDGRCAKILAEVMEVLEMNASYSVHPRNSRALIREPYATIVHTDLWVNNIMVKFDEGKLSKVKFLDFQIYEYGSPARDVIFFLFTSVQVPVLKKHYQQLIDHYHGELVKILRTFECDTSEFSLKNFEVELDTAVKQFELLHCLMLFKVIYASKEDVKEMDQITVDLMTEEMEMSDQHKEKIAFLINFFHQRGWI